MPLADRAFAVLVWGLAFHVFAMALLFGPVGLAEGTVRAIAAWKELFVLLLLTGAGWRLVHDDIRRRVGVADLAAITLGVLVAMRAGLDWLNVGVPPSSSIALYGARDLLVPFALYAVGRVTPELLDHPRLVARLALVAVVIAVLGVLERLLPLEALVLAGVPRYYQDFLNVAETTNPYLYGLPNSYFTDIGRQSFRRIGSVFLSGQACAVALLVLMPAVQVRAMRASGAGAVWRWAAFALAWGVLLFTVTRMTIVAAAVQGVAVLLLAGRPLAVGFLTAAGASLAAVGVIVSSGLRDFVWRTLTFETQSSVSHVTDWTEGLEALWEHPFGAGLATADITAVRVGRTPLTADNLFFKYAVELGWPGLVAFAVFVASALLAAAVLARRAAPGPTRDAGLVAFAVTLGVAINGATAVVTNLPFTAYVWAWLAGAAVARAQRPA